MDFEKYKFWFMGWFKLFGTLICVIWFFWFIGWVFSFFTVFPDTTMRNVRLTLFFVVLNIILAFASPIFISKSSNEDR